MKGEGGMLVKDKRMGEKERETVDVMGCQYDQSIVYKCMECDTKKMMLFYT